MAKKTFNDSISQASQYVINPLQLGGIELFSTLDGPGYPNRVAWVNTGSGLSYKVVIDRGLDIAEAFYKGQSLAWMSLSGITRPEVGLNKSDDWLWGFFGGLMVSCGQTNAGAPSHDQGKDVPQHGRHSNLSATVESVLNPDPVINRDQMSISGIVREAKLFEPNIELRRTIRSPLGKSMIIVEDNFVNRGMRTSEHAWLLHINLGYPLLEPGAELIYNADIEPLPASVNQFTKEKFWIAPKPKNAETMGESVAYFTPKTGSDGMVHCGVINSKRQIGVKISFSKRDFPRYVIWQHFGPNGQYVMGIEPANCGVQGRAKDRETGWLKFLKPGQKKKYQTTIEVLEGKDQLDAFRKQVQKK